MTKQERKRLKETVAVGKNGTKPEERKEPKPTKQKDKDESEVKV